MFENFDVKDRPSNILHLKNSNTYIEILNFKFDDGIIRKSDFIQFILICIQIITPKIRNITGIYCNEDLEWTGPRYGLQFTHYDNINLLDYLLDNET